MRRQQRKGLVRYVYFAVVAVFASWQSMPVGLGQ